MGFLKRAKNKIKAKVSNVASITKSTINNVKARTNDIVKGARERINDTVSDVRERSEDIQDRIDDVRDNIDDRFDDLRSSARDIRDRKFGFKFPEPFLPKPFDPTTIIQETERNVTNTIKESADEVNETNNVNIIEILEQIKSQVTGPLRTISPAAAFQIENDIDVVKQVIDNLTDIISIVINAPEEISKTEFVNLVSENTELLTESSEFILKKVSESIPEGNILSDIFDIIETTNIERGTTKTKFVLMMGKDPADEESTRSSLRSELIVEVDQMEDELDVLKSKTPQQTISINNLDAEIDFHTNTINELNSPLVLDISTDIFNYVTDYNTQQKLQIALDGSETEIVEPEFISVSTDIPRTRQLTFDLVNPAPTINETSENRINQTVGKRIIRTAKNLQKQSIVPKSKPVKQHKQEMRLNEDAMIKRILNKTNLDEILTKEWTEKNNKTGYAIISPETRDKLRISKLEEELSDEETDQNILNKLNKNVDQYLKLMEEYDVQAKKDPTLKKPINPEITRNLAGYVLSDETLEEAKLPVKLVDNRMLRRTTFENLVDVDFKEIELPFIEDNEIEELEEKIKQLENDIIDLNSDKKTLTTNKTKQRKDITAKELKIETLNDQMETLRERFTTLPSAGTVFSIPALYGGKSKTELDYWIIENGERRRIKNYAMAQVILDNNGKTIEDIQIFPPAVIRTIKQGSDMRINEVAVHWSTQQGIERNLYIIDECIEGGKLKIYHGELQEEVHEDITFARVIGWMRLIADGSWPIGDLKPLVEYQDESVEKRFWLVNSALFQVSTQLNTRFAQKKISDAAKKAAQKVIDDAAIARQKEEERLAKEKAESAMAIVLEEAEKREKRDVAAALLTGGVSLLVPPAVKDKVDEAVKKRVPEVKTVTKKVVKAIAKAKPPAPKVIVKAVKGLFKRKKKK
jgi:hypothetical protein